MIERYTNAADAVREGEFGFALSFSIVAGIFGIFVVLAWLLVGSLFLDWQTVKVGLAVAVVLTGFVIGGFITTGAARGWILAGRILGQILSEPSKEPVKPVAPSTPTVLPTLPAAETPIQYNHFSRGGQSIPRTLIHGFDPRDLEWLARYLANGGRFTEAAMEKLTLPYSLELMGKAQEGTHYFRLMQLCAERGIIVGRDAKKSGVLAVTEYQEILRKLKTP